MSKAKRTEKTSHKNLNVLGCSQCQAIKRHDDSKRTDKQRLDWLTKHGQNLNFHYFYKWQVTVKGTLYHMNKTPRQAIDSAMDAKEGK